MDQSLSSGRGHVSVLSCFPPSVGRDIAVAVVKPLRTCVENPVRRSLLQTDKQVSVLPVWKIKCTLRCLSLKMIH